MLRPYLSSLILAVAVVATAFILTDAFRHRHQSSHAIRVTGLGSQDFVSDLIVWSGSFSQKSLNLKEAYAALDRDRDRINRYLTSKGVAADQVVFSSVRIDRDFDYQFDSYGNRMSSVFTGYRLTQNVQIESPEVDKVEDLSRRVSELINAGVEFYSNDPQYYYTRLAELKVEMIAAATRDAQQRADQIAQNANSRVGRLKQADMGVFQIVAQNSSEDYSWGGAFNTTAKRKTATITVRLEYEAD